MDTPRGVHLVAMAIVAGAALLLNGCYEWVAWSPDGKRVAYVREEKTVCVYDTETRQTTRVYQGDAVGACRFFPDGNALLLAKGDDSRTLLRVALEGGSERVLAEDVAMLGFDLSADGKQLYAVIDEKTLYRIAVSNPESRERLADLSEEVSFLRRSPDGKRLLCCGERRIFQVDAETGKELGAALTPPSEKHGFMGIAWVDDDRFLYFSYVEGREDEELGTLYLRNLETGESKSIAERCYLGLAPTVDAQREWVYMTCAAKGASMDDPSSFQVYRVNLGSGKQEKLTQESEGALCPVMAPTGQHLAYLAGAPEDTAELVLMDLAKDDRPVTRAPAPS